MQSFNMGDTGDARVLERIRKFNLALDGLMGFYSSDTLSSVEFARMVTQEASRMLGAERVSAWSLIEDGSGIECLDLYQASDQAHVDGVTLYMKDFPRYFAAVQSERVIAANDASADPRTSEFTDVYLKPNRIVSMLDTQIRSAAGPRGVVCIETVDVARDWSPDEIAFAVSVAELLGFSMDREDRRHVAVQLEDANARLEVAVATAEEARERFDLAMRAAYDGVWDCDLVADDVYLSEQNYILLGDNGPTPDAPFDWWITRLHPEDSHRVLQAFEDLKHRDTPYDMTYRIRHEDGSWRWWRSRGQAQRNGDDQAVRIVGTNSDVTPLVEAQGELEKRNKQLTLAKKEVENSALHDVLTGLPNRRFMDQVCTNILQAAADKGQTVSILHIDLDLFKEVNDKFGHAVGDATLKHTAQLLQSLKAKDEFVARIGGDEFVAILFDTQDAKRAIQFSTQLNMLFDESFVIQGFSFDIGASIGIALSDDGNTDIWRLLGNADLALYEAKKKGRNRFEIFDETLRIQSAFIRNTKEELRSALAQGQGLVPFFQPQFYAKSLELAGAEVLARWDHPTRGWLAPSQFLEFATEMNCVADIDRQILTKSIAAAREWRSDGFDVPRLSVNVSSERLNDPSLIDCVEEIADEAHLLSFELLESTFLDDTSADVTGILARLRHLGIEVEIDDFGSGYASILSLVNIRPTRLKIDRTLTKNVDTERALSGLVKSIVEIARTLKIEVVAEGVETPAQIAALTEIGCDVLQGFGLAAPMSASNFFSKFHGKKNGLSNAIAS